MPVWLKHITNFDNIILNLTVVHCRSLLPVSLLYWLHNNNRNIHMHLIKTPAESYDRLLTCPPPHYSPGEGIYCKIYLSTQQSSNSCLRSDTAGESVHFMQRLILKFFSNFGFFQIYLCVNIFFWEKLKERTRRCPRAWAKVTNF